MGFRFRQVINLVPGVKLNISKSGVGMRGAWLNFGRRGLRGTVGLPGTGLSYDKVLWKPGSKIQEEKPGQGTIEWLVQDQLDAVSEPRSAWPGMLAIIGCFLIGLVIVGLFL